MSKKANTTLIGGFVLAAIFLAVASVLVLGSGKFFKKTQKFVMFFEGSVKGLQVGAPVVIRGVEVGQVTAIVLEYDPARMTTSIPVYAEIDLEKITVIGSTARESQKAGLQKTELIDRGLRAQLQTQSFVTGMLMVDLDFRPNSPARLVGLEKRYPEIPTVPTDRQQMSKKLDELPVQEIATSLARTLDGIDRLVNSPHVQSTLDSVDKLVADLDRLAIDGNKHIARVSSRAEKLMDGIDGQVAAVGGSTTSTTTAARDTLAHATAALDEARGAISDLRELAASNANVGHQLSQSLAQVTALTRSLRSVSDYLDRYPESLLRGKGGP